MSDFQAECHLILWDGYVRAKRTYESTHAGVSVIVTCAQRDWAAQFALFKQGRMCKHGEDPNLPASWVLNPVSKIVTQIDGKTNRSNHNYSPSRALDFAVVVNGKVTWEEGHYYEFGKVAHSNPDLRWGGDWSRWKDLPHLELAPGVRM